VEFAHRSIANARVQAFTKLVGAPGNAFIGGPVLDDPADARLRHSHWRVPFDGTNQDAEYLQFLDGEWNYVGPVYGHFGHVMAEMVHRILPAMQKFKCRNWLAVTHAGGHVTYADLPAVYRSVLIFFDIGPDNLKVINRNTVVSTLNIVEQGSDLGGGPKPGYLDMLAAFSHPKLDQILPRPPVNRKVYVSRSKIPHGGSFLGERYIETLLADEGFDIFHPEDWLLSTQMLRYRHADLLVFPEGSACHGVELLGAHSLGRVYVLMRRASHRGTFTAILGPRASRLATTTEMPYLGTVRLHPEDKRLLTEVGVSVFDLDHLVGFLRSHGIAELSTLDPAAYFDAAAADLEAYFQYSLEAKSPVVGPEGFEAIRAELARLRQNFLKAGSNVVSDLVRNLLPDLTGDGYLKVLAEIHEALSPRSYLEIGCYDSSSLALAKCDSIGINPNLTNIGNVMKGKTVFKAYQMTSEKFFMRHNPAALLGRPIDLAFLDGLHLLEVLLHEFANTEKNCLPSSTIIMHDCIPTDAFVAGRINDPARRPAHPDWWTGDVWKMLPILRKYRPDLKLQAVDAAPTGLVLVSNLDPASAVLMDRFATILDEWVKIELTEYGLERFTREAQVIATADFRADLRKRGER
jgi:hypothetical protein